jgi:hypothetical protein
LADVEAALLHGRPETPRLLWNVAHVYSQLAGQWNFGRRAKNPPSAAAIQADYQNKAVGVLFRALELQPTPERATAFWNNYIAPDPLLDPLRGSSDFQRLERAYGKGKG